MVELISFDGLVALTTLTTLEIVLGIDNIVFIAVVAGKLPPELRDRARLIGLSLAIVTRLLLLFLLSWLASLTAPLISVLNKRFSGRDLILLFGGLFLIYKATREIHSRTEGTAEETNQEISGKGFSQVIVQILLIDLIFSLDSVITAVGMTDQILIMSTAVILAVLVMLAFSKFIVDFISRHPTVKMLALSFLLLIGVLLVMEGWGHHIEKGYIYFAMAFSLFVELLNLRSRRHLAPGAPLLHRDRTRTAYGPMAR
jgi:predicted tellurium resistance membrane protein TerC